MGLPGDDAFELKLIFLRELAAGHAIAAAALDRLGRDGSDRAALGELRRFFHTLAGTASAADLGLLGRLAAACETVADGLQERSSPADWRELQIFAEGVAGAAAVLEGEGTPAAPAGPASKETAALAGGSSRILVVDDDPFSARVVDSVLRGAGFQSSFVCEAESAFDVIQREAPDLLVLDVVMPRMDGFRLCQQVRAHPGLQHTPIIFVTRKGDVEQRVRGLQVGGDDYVAKPFEPQELVARVRSHLLRLSALRELAIRDGLTRCYNNKHFKLRLEQEVARAHRYSGELTLGMLDVDHFKHINDGYGHPAGDAVLAHLASIVTASVRSTDVVARYGGEEFGFLLVEAGAPEAEIIVDRMRERVAQHVFEVPSADGELLTIRCTVSIGLAALTGADTQHTLLQRADGALYEAKAKGRNRVCVAA
jgi:diguanylate cyclase (GGDEF)-like protein